jgi:AcrR family transcriptional regulator
VCQAALDLIDRDGVDALSMRRLAADLGVEAMSLYHWVPSKDALLDGVVEELAAEYPSPGLGAGSWRDQLARYLHELRAVLLRHPNAVGLVASRPIMTERTVEVAETALVGLTALGLSDREAGALLHVLHTFVLGHVLGQVGELGAVRGRDFDEIWAFRRSVDAHRYPRFAAGLAGEPDPDTEFALGLTLLLDGLEARVTA